MKLSRTQIVGSPYRFINNPKPHVEYEYKGATRTFPLRLKEEHYDDGRGFRVQVSCSTNNTIGHLLSVEKEGQGYLLDISLGKSCRGMGLSSVLINMHLSHLVRTRGVDPAGIFVQNVVGNKRATFGALVGIMQFGFSIMDEEALKTFWMRIWSLESCRPGTMSGKKGEPVDVFIAGAHRVMFYPPISREQIESLKHSRSSLESMFARGSAFLDKTNYYLSPEAQEIMPDYVRLLPQNPPITISDFD